MATGLPGTLDCNVDILNQRRALLGGLPHGFTNPPAVLHIGIVLDPLADTPREIRIRIGSIAAPMLTDDQLICFRDLGQREPASEELIAKKQVAM